MEEIVRINLDNEMDLILAHKRSLKLSELCGLSLSAQTTFATAVSELARCAIGNGENSQLILGIDSLRGNKKQICAVLFNKIDLLHVKSEALSYAKRLMGDLHSQKIGELYEVRINHLINFSGILTPSKIANFKDYFVNEPPLSPYDEIRKKNIQLIELSDKLKVSENQYKLLTDRIPLMIFVLNTKGELSFANKGLKDFIGTDINYTDHHFWKKMLHPKDSRMFLEEWDRSIANKSAFSTQTRLKGKEHTTYNWHLVSIVPVKTEGEQISQWIGYFVNIHSQKLIEETLKDNVELKNIQKSLKDYQSKLENKINELNASNYDLEQFAYIASHDLQEPLRKIKTYISLLNKTLVLKEKEETYFQKILFAANRMSDLIKDVLSYSRLSKDQDKFSMVDLNHVLSNIMLDLELVIQEKNAKITSESLPVMNAIPRQVGQLFYNLINNSLKFSNGDPQIKIQYRDMTEDELEKFHPVDNRSYKVLVFSDNGIGFEQQYANKIFTIFQRLSTNREIPGTGVGLALCKKIVENHEGYISAEGKPGEGATFKIVFPV